MKSLKVYTTILYDFVIALCQLCYRVVRQVALPSCKRRGNVLSSLFLFFTGLVENLISFGESLGRVPSTFREKFIRQATLNKAWTFSQRYLRQGMLIATWALFILSSIEWTEPRQPSTDTATIRQEAAAPAKSICRQTATSAITITHGLSVIAVSGKSFTTFSPHLPGPVTSLNIDRWLLLCIIRI